MVIRGWNLMSWNRTSKAMTGKVSVELLDHFKVFGRLPAHVGEVLEDLRRKEALASAAKLEEDPRPLTDFPVKAELFKHQIRGANCALLTFGWDPAAEGFEAAQNGGRGYGELFEMGCGKTLTAIAIAGVLWQYGKVNKLLVVAPTSVVGVWPKEFAEYADFAFVAAPLLGDKSKRIEALKDLDRDRSGALQVAIINYESTWREGIYEALEGWDPDMIIADESQRIKTHDAAQSKAMHKLGDRARYKLILSGTPVQNNAVDIFSQYRFLDPSVFGTNYYAFRNHYAVMGGFNKKQIVGYRDLEDLIRREHSIAYRVTKAEALDLPEQTFENRYVQLDANERRTYDQLRRDSYAELENGDSITAATVLTKLLRLQQLTGGFMQTDDAPYPKHVHNAKLDALREIIEECVDQRQKVVVFARFTPEIDLICKELERSGIKCGMIDGRTPLEHKKDQLGVEHMSRSEIVQDFQTNPETLVFVAQIQTAGLGITLHAASVAVFYSLDFNYANYTQATARIHRIGQRNCCTYIHIIAEKTVDEKVLKAIEAKDDLARGIVDNWREVLG